MPIDRLICAALLTLAVFMAPASALSEARPSKDQGPASATCDRFGKETAAWLDCAGAAKAQMPDQELFYAGYWLAKSGRYQEALTYLTRARTKDEKILTYIGFATRKLGDVDKAMPFYAEALKLNPGYSVARAYLGEAHLTRGEPEKAASELEEIEWRCGRTCAEYADLASRIAEYRAGPMLNR
jgi:tetratricopeptide (TPR) repeat protein